jgi:hypothetical protein
VHQTSNFSPLTHIHVLRTYGREIPLKGSTATFHITLRFTRFMPTIHTMHDSLNFPPHQEALPHALPFLSPPQDLLGKCIHSFLSTSGRNSSGHKSCESQCARSFFGQRCYSFVFVKCKCCETFSTTSVT